MSEVKIPEAEEPLLDNLPFVRMYVAAKPGPSDHISYEIIGTPDEKVPPWDPEEKRFSLRDERPVPKERQIYGTYEFHMYGKVLNAPKEWAGYECAVEVNCYGTSFEENLTPYGYIGGGWCETVNKLVHVRLTLPPMIVRDLMNVWGFFSPDRHNLQICQFRCDLIGLRQRTGEPESVVYKIFRLYTDDEVTFPHDYQD